MRLSFVVPAFNEELYLGDCLRSILRDTAGFEDAVEILVVNNASTDGTREVALSFPGVRVVEERIRGLSRARQAGFMAATGDLVANVDADSRLPAGWTQRVLGSFAADRSMVALSGPLVYYDLPSSKRLLVRGFYAMAWVSYAVNRYLLGVGSMVQGGNFVVTRAAMEQIGGCNVSILFYGEDTDLARRLHKVGRVRFTFRLKMLSSARRLKHEGLLRMAWRYGMNYMWTTFRKRPFTEVHQDIREEQPG